MKKYDFVARNFNDDGMYVGDNSVVINGKSFNNLYDIDKYTSGKKINDIWKDIFLKNKVIGFNSLMIKVDDGNFIKYEDIIINNKVINACVCDINKNGNINRKNSFFKKELKEFLIFIKTYDLKIFKDCLLNEDEDFFILLNDFIEDKESNVYDEIINKFSDYSFFRNWILRKEDIKKRGFYDNYLKDYYKKNNEFFRRISIKSGDFVSNDLESEFLFPAGLVKIKK